MNCKYKSINKECKQYADRRNNLHEDFEPVATATQYGSHQQNVKRILDIYVNTSAVMYKLM